jgi:hypothetical protein
MVFEVILDSRSPRFRQSFVDIGLKIVLAVSVVRPNGTIGGFQ